MSDIRNFFAKKRKISTEDETSNKDVEVSVPPSSNEEPADVPPILDRYDDFNMNNDSEEESQPPPLEVEPPISDPLSDDDEEDTNNNTTKSLPATSSTRSCDSHTWKFTIETEANYRGIDPYYYFEKGSFSPYELETILKNPLVVGPEYTFPLREYGSQKRGCNYKIIATFKDQGLVYSPAFDGFFCMACVLFACRTSAKGYSI